MPLLRVTAPYDFELSTRTLRSGPPHYWKGREYRRLLELPSGPVLLRLSCQHQAGAPGCELRWKTSPPVVSGEAAMATSQLLERMFSTPVALESCYAVLGRDAGLRSVLEPLYGLKRTLSPSLYEALLESLLEQRRSPAQALVLRSRLLELHGRAVQFEGSTYRSYPPPLHLRVLSPRRLAGDLDVPVTMAETLVAAASAATGQAIVDPPAALEHLLRIPGVGLGAASEALWRSLPDPDVMPAYNRDLQLAVQRRYVLRQRPLAPQLQRRWAQLAPWRGYAALYCLAAAQDAPAGPNLA